MTQNSIGKYLSLVKFSHTIFALPFAFIGFFLAVWHAGYNFEWSKLLLVILCMVFARSAAMAFNRYIDREIDLQNPRTKVREIPSGKVSPKSALFFVVLNCLFFVACTWFINPLCFALSPIALGVVLGYSYTKRFTFLCHFVLGIGLALAPIGAYLAVSGTFNWLPLFFSFAVLFWVSGFDIIYSLQDEDFDKKLKLYSIPVAMGKKNALLTSVALHALSGFFIVLAGFYAEFNWLYWAGASVFILLLAYQHMLVKPHDLSKVNLAFFTTNGIASVIFACFVLAELIFKAPQLF